MSTASPFPDRLRAAQAAVGSTLCVGLDPDPATLVRSTAGVPVGLAVVAACTDLVRATADVACAYKPNAAFFEALGADGSAVLFEVVAAVRRHAPHALVVLDGKRGDVGHTAAMYARAAFDALGADAATVAPYMGAASVTPFLGDASRAAFVLACTSNPGADAVQALDVGGEPLFERVVRLAQGWGRGHPGTLGFVAGATDASALARIRALAPDAPLLVPGIGAQGGDLAAVLDANAGGPVLVNVGRAIAGADDPAAAARALAARMPVG